MKTRFLLGGLVVAAGCRLMAAPLTESTFTEIVKDVNVVAEATRAATPANVKDVVKAPDLVRTGPESRAELTAPDQTITRVGANTVFSFEPAGRDLDLERGSLLFHSPGGKGGGTIKSGGAAAAVLGTTIIVAATPSGGFKVIILEGKGKVTWPNGESVSLKAGQLVFVLPGQAGPGPVLDINLARLVGGSLLVNGFSHELPSAPRIHDAIKRQEIALSTGRAEDTGTPADNFAKHRRTAGNGMNALDQNTYQTAAGTITAGQLRALLNPKQGSFPRLSTPGGRGIFLVTP